MYLLSSFYPDFTGYHFFFLIQLIEKKTTGLNSADNFALLILMKAFCIVCVLGIVNKIW
jgi:hypothetical protein